jgi:hypothetical protein
MNVWRLVGNTLNITCNFLYCNHQVHRDFLITLYILVNVFLLVSVFLIILGRYKKKLKIVSFEKFCGLVS